MVAGWKMLKPGSLERRQRILKYIYFPNRLKKNSTKHHLRNLSFYTFKFDEFFIKPLQAPLISNGKSFDISSNFHPIEPAHPQCASNYIDKLSKMFADRSTNPMNPIWKKNLPKKNKDLKILFLFPFFLYFPSFILNFD